MAKTTEQIAAQIEAGATTLGIEFGSTRIKAVLNGRDNEPVAIGTFDWENSLVDGYWTYGDDEVFAGLAACYASLKADVRERYGVTLRRVGALGISAMMHGYLAFDARDELLVPFRTWRNTTTLEAARKLTELFGFHIPERWSIAHLYQAILSGEEHAGRVAHLTTLAGYVHWRLTGQRVLSVGDASGMFPIDPSSRGYDEEMLRKFDGLPEVRALGLHVGRMLPRVLVAGERAGELTAEGAALLDAEGDLEPGCPLCPPEGDAGTGMIATNSVAPRTRRWCARRPGATPIRSTTSRPARRGSRSTASTRWWRACPSATPPMPAPSSSRTCASHRRSSPAPTCRAHAFSSSDVLRLSSVGVRPAATMVAWIPETNTWGGAFAGRAHAGASRPLRIGHPRPPSVRASRRTPGCTRSFPAGPSSPRCLTCWTPRRPCQRRCAPSTCSGPRWRGSSWACFLRPTLPS